MKSRELQSDGDYKRLSPADGQKTTQAQLTFRELARRQSASPADTQKIQIKPILSPPTTSSTEKLSVKVSSPKPKTTKKA